MKSELGSTKLHELIQEKWDRDFERSEERWINYLGKMGFRKTKIEFVPSSTPEGHRAYNISPPDHDGVFFVLDPMDPLYFLSVPQELALKIMTLGAFP